MSKKQLEKALEHWKIEHIKAMNMPDRNTNGFTNMAKTAALRVAKRHIKQLEKALESSDGN